jgi:hypothetical protein
MASLQPVKGLYYSQIQFGSLGWLRAALLYWEGFLRIVPDGFETLDSPEVHELVIEGFIEDVSPARYLRSAREVFGGHLEELLRTRMGRTLGGHRESGALIHVGEIEQGLLHELKARGLASSAGEWASMSPDIAMLYKITLANEVGQELQAAPATDESGYEVADWYFAGRELARDGKAAALVDGFACVRLIEPFGLLEAGAISTATLVGLRKRYVAERRAFRERVQEHLSAIATLPSVEAIRSRVEDFVHEIEEEVAAHRDALRTSSLRSALEALRVSAPAAVGAAVTLAGAPLAIAVAGVFGSVGLGATDWFVQRRHAVGANGDYLLLLEAAIRRGRAWQRSPPDVKRHLR